MRVVVAPDSFKGSATADAVAQAIVAGWRAIRPDDDVVAAPMADGGEGTLDAFAAAQPAAARVPVRVTGPDDRPVESAFLLLPDGTAVVELASTSGLGLLTRLRPMDAHTRGFGQAIAAALDVGAKRLLLAIGGSASTDGGAGMLTALGARFSGAAGDPAGFGEPEAVDLSALRTLPAGGAIVLCDVVAPLLGPAGAAAVFGPQKGASSTQVQHLESRLRRLSMLLPANPTIAGAGAAGGTGFALLSWGATLQPGAATVAAAIGLPELLAGAGVVITGEGRFDHQSTLGKVPSLVLQLAGRRPTCLVAGQIAAEPAGFIDAVALVDLAGSAAASLADPLRYARLAGERLAAGRWRMAAERLDPSKSG